MSTFTHLIQIGPDLWNIRGSFTFALGMVDIGTHMSIVKLKSGRFLIIDTIKITPDIKREIDQLTNNGNLVDAVIATHPFHTVFFKPFYDLYPNLRFIGTPRHIRNITSIPWKGDMNDPAVRNQWEADGIFCRIPDGADFVNPAENNHFISVFVLHEASRTIHVDDTIMFYRNPGFVLRCAGCHDGDMDLHPSTLKEGLLPTIDAPLEFRYWLRKLIDEWDFDNICAAHTGNKIGGAKAQLETVYKKYDPLLGNLAKKRKGPH